MRNRNLPFYLRYVVIILLVGCECVSLYVFNDTLMVSKKHGDYISTVSCVYIRYTDMYLF